MVAPYAHGAVLSELPAETMAEMMSLAQRSEQVFKRRLQGSRRYMNIGMRYRGKAAGAGVAGHLHLHVLPRWFADANFMTTIGETRVITENLSDTLKKLRPLFTSASDPTKR